MLLTNSLTVKKQPKHRGAGISKGAGLLGALRVAVGDNFSLFFSSRVSSPASSLSSLTLSFFQASPTGGFLGHTVFFLFIAGLRNVIQTCTLTFGVHILNSAA